MNSMPRTKETAVSSEKCKAHEGREDLEAAEHLENDSSRKNTVVGLSSLRLALSMKVSKGRLAP